MHLFIQFCRWGNRGSTADLQSALWFVTWPGSTEDLDRFHPTVVLLFAPLWALPFWWDSFSHGLHVCHSLSLGKHISWSNRAEFHPIALWLGGFKVWYQPPAGFGAVMHNSLVVKLETTVTQQPGLVPNPNDPQTSRCKWKKWKGMDEFVIL